MKRSQAKACGILFCYNEEQILSETIQHYLKQGIDLVVIDNESTDSSREIVSQFRQKAELYSGKIQDVVNIQTKGYEWRKILQFACEYMHQNLSNYEWIMLIDADAIYHSPVKGMSLLEFLGFMKKKGYNVIHGKVFEFYPTEKDDPSVSSPIRRLKYYRVIDEWSQQKIFQYHPSLNFYESWGHTCFRENQHLSPIDFWYHHYPWVSYEHGIKKIFKERKPRYVERKKRLDIHWHYLGMLPLKKDLIKSSKNLIYYRPEKLLMSRAIFFGLFKVIDERRLRTISVAEQAEPKPYAVDIPRDCHFLMTDFCNARCTFCNQDFSSHSKNEITFEKFQIMLSHLSIKAESTFHFSGGGDPLLCSDLFKIIRYVNHRLPWIKVRIRTNGLLIKRYVQELAEVSVDRLEISIHGATAETNNRILQRTTDSDVFENLVVLNKHLKTSGSRMQKIFCPVISQVNIDELPELIKRAEELNVGEVDVSFCRYYPQNHHTFNGYVPAKPEDSLFFNKQKYNDVILQSKEIAKSLGISFYYPPLFFSQFKKRPCLQPWQTLVINWNGEIYPCTGGEVWFKQKVNSGDYQFGNLLKEDLSECWHNDTYTRLRRTLSQHPQKNFIPECTNCHNIGCFQGSDIKSGHILKPLSSSLQELVQ